LNFFRPSARLGEHCTRCCAGSDPRRIEFIATDKLLARFQPAAERSAETTLDQRCAAGTKSTCHRRELADERGTWIGRGIGRALLCVVETEHLGTGFLRRRRTGSGYASANQTAADRADGCANTRYRD
jgi:hypothetical protein